MDQAPLRDQIVAAFPGVTPQLQPAARYVLDNPRDVALASETTPSQTAIPELKARLTRPMLTARDIYPGEAGRPAPSFAQLMAGIEDDELIAAVRGLFGHPVFGGTRHLGIEGLLKASMRLDLSRLPDGVRFVTGETLLRPIFTASDA